MHGACCSVRSVGILCLRLSHRLLHLVTVGGEGAIVGHRLHRLVGVLLPHRLQRLLIVMRHSHIHGHVNIRPIIIAILSLVLLQDVPPVLVLLLIDHRGLLVRSLIYLIDPERVPS